MLGLKQFRAERLASWAGGAIYIDYDLWRAHSWPRRLTRTAPLDRMGAAADGQLAEAEAEAAPRGEPRAASNFVKAARDLLPRLDVEQIAGSTAPQRASERGCRAQ